MLTESGYIGGFVFYISAALIALALFNLWFLPRVSIGVRALVTLPLAALLITPAYIEPEAATLAPALVVAAFTWLSNDIEAAMHSLRPLGLFTALAFVLGLIAFVADTLRRRRHTHDPEMDLSAE